MDIQEPRVSGVFVAWRVIRFWLGNPPYLSLSLEVFILSWSFKSLEMAAFVWLISMALFLFMIGIVCLINHHRKRSSNAT